MTYRSWTIQSCRTSGFNSLQVDYPSRQFFSPEDGWQKWPSSHVAHKVGFLWGGWGLRGCITPKSSVEGSEILGGKQSLCTAHFWWARCFRHEMHVVRHLGPLYQATRPPELNSPPGHPNHISASEGGFDTSAAESMDWFLDSCRSLGSMAARQKTKWFTTFRTFHVAECCLAVLIVFFLGGAFQKKRQLCYFYCHPEQKLQPIFFSCQKRFLFIASIWALLARSFHLEIVMLKPGSILKFHCNGMM